MKSFLFICLYVSVIIQKEQFEEIQIGKNLPKNTIVDSSKKIFQLIGSSSLLPAIKVKFKNINYNVVLNEKKKVIFIITFDKSFISNEGYKVGTSYRTVRKKYKSKCLFEPGRGYYLKLNSNWVILFSNKNNIPETKINNDSRIQSFLKKDNQ